MANFPKIVPPLRWKRSPSATWKAHFAGWKSPFAHWKNWRGQPSNFSRVDLKNHKGTWLIHLCGKVLILGAILTALGFGASSQRFTIKTRLVLGSTVDPDLQLAFLGLINKIMDLLITKALQVTAGVMITVWMTRSKSGARLADFELGEELTKPWAALSKFAGRWSTLGWRHAGWPRMLVALSVSVCVLLQGLAINTIGVPKERWYPEDWNADTAMHPRVELVGLDWTNFWDTAFLTAGGGDTSWRVMDGYIASAANTAFRDFAWLMEINKPVGWHDFGPSGEYFAALDTRYNGSSSRGIAVQSNQTMDIFRWMQANGIANARRSHGLNGDVKLTTPSTLVTCHPLQRSAYSVFADTDAASVFVDVVSRTVTTEALFQVHLQPVPADDFLGATCEIHFQQLLFPANVWNTDSAETASASVNKYGQKHDIEPEVLPFAPVDVEIANNLTVQMNNTMHTLDRLFSGMTCARWLVKIAKDVHLRRSDYQSDIEALAPVLALFANQLLAMSRWYTTLGDDQVMSTSLRWQLFGSGPRLPWAWVCAVVLGVLVVALACSIFLSLWYRIIPGEFTKAGGMLVAANSSAPITDMRSIANNPRDKLEAMVFVINQAGVDVVEINAVSPTRSYLDTRKAYKWVQ